MYKVAKLLLPVAAAVAVPAFAFSSPYQDVTAEVGDDDEPDFPWPDFLSVTPQPGNYEMEMRITDVSIPTGSEMEYMADALMAEPPETRSYCLEGEPERVDWVNEFMDGACTAANLQVDGNRFTQTLQCREMAAGAPAFDIRMSGEGSEQGMDLQMTMRMHDPSVGKITFAMEVDLQRTGDCE
ncbi:DUF3617 domain-containing protein [Aurantiacibacter sp. MUD61]|uniref:DUF3617 domain-containing protein n=1 Tax=Aurantiacibacter sp. MUD61 TaxID=3009083 RepID=UPI0022EFF78C|nr:DUF3617 family protein [Aurantiacibacter sp. MUD61]